MAEIKPELTESIPDVLTCPFCEGIWDFRLSDSFKNAELTFICNKCKKIIRVSKHG